MHPVTSQYDGHYNIVNTNCYYLAPSLRMEVPGGGVKNTQLHFRKSLATQLFASMAAATAAVVAAIKSHEGGISWCYCFHFG